MAKAWKLILKYAFILAVFCGAAGLLLPAVYELTTPRKIENQKKLEAESLRLVFPEANRIEPRENYYEAFDAQGKINGYVLKIVSRGYSSDVEMLVGLTAPQLDITGVKILAQTETPGLGTRIGEDWFTDSLIGHKIATLQLKKDGGAIDGITGATITSRAVIDGIRREISVFKNTLGANNL